MTFPAARMRRMRRTPSLRRLVRETRLDPADLVQPLFVVAGGDIEEEVPSMPGIARRSVDRLVPHCRDVRDAGLGAVILFGIPEGKDPEGSSSWAVDGVVQQALAALEAAVPELVLIADVCLCEYTDHGHCGVVDEATGEIRNDPTLELLARQAVSFADAGADIVAPSDMMDGRVAAIRAALDDAGHQRVAILSYAAKYASAFYGPFRDAADSAPSFGDRRSYQMDPPNVREAMREVELDVAEGADILMVKPALPYLDVLSRLRARFDHPLAAYHVSGEYAALRAAAANGWIDYESALMESLLAVKRAGADMIISYGARDAARLLRRETVS